MLKPGQRSVPDVHGLTVFPDDGNNLVAHMGPASVRVESNPSLFVAALEKLADQDIALHDPHLIAAIRLLVTVQGGGPVLRQGGTIGRPSKTEIRASITRKPFLRIVEI